MVCKLCGSTIEEYIKWLFREKRQVKRFECPVCGPLHFKTLLPLKGGDGNDMTLNDEFY